METTITNFENLASTGFFEDVHVTYALSFPGDDDDDEEDDDDAKPNDDNPPEDEEVVHSPVPTQGGKPR